MVGFLPWQEGGAFGRAWFVAKGLRLDLSFFYEGTRPRSFGCRIRCPSARGVRNTNVSFFTKDRGQGGRAHKLPGSRGYRLNQYTPWQTPQTLIRSVNPKP